MLKVLKQTKSDSIPFVYEYFLSVPPDYNEDKKWPLLLFLHGAGECQSPIEKLLQYGPPKLIHHYSRNRQDTQLTDDFNLETEKFLAENFIVCSPQVNQGERWNTQVLINLLDQIEKNYKVDQNKIYVTGLSMGKFRNI